VRGGVATEEGAAFGGRAAVAIAGIGYLAVAVGTLFAVPAVSEAGFTGIYATDLSLGASFTTIGLLVSRRRSDNPIGWLFLAIGVIEALTAAFNHYAIVGLGPRDALPGATWAAWIAYWSVSLIVPAGLFLLLILVFPNGRPVSQRWAWFGWLGLAFSVLFALSEILLLPRMEVSTRVVIDNPTNVASSEVPEFAWVFGLIFIVGGVISLLSRYRRAGGEERQQLRWFVSAVGLSIGSLIALTIAYFALGAPEPEPGWFVAATTTVTLVGIGIGVPAACGIAVLRYRLWDLDIVIRKTAVVALVTALISVVYVAIVGGIGALVGSRLDTALAFAAAAVLAVAFQPIRRRAGRFADRLVYGRRATPYEVLSDFSGRLGEAYADDDVLPRMAEILGEGTGADAATVWLHVGRELRPAASWPLDRELRAVAVRGERVPNLGEPVFDVRHRGELLGALSVSLPANDPMDPTKDRLVRDLASQAGLVLRNVRLIEEVRASRQRLVAAQDEERRKIERNLHDGAQQQLVALQVQLRLMEQQVGRNTDAERDLVQRLQQAASAALEDLRDLARGIYPPLLADQGLVAALEAQARRSPVRVTVESDGIERYPREVEAAMYFCALEALNNVSKYAEATSVQVSLSDEDGTLRLRIRDDGRGFDTSATGYGTGLQGMADRLDAIGGALEISSEPGRGTTVIGRIPPRRSIGLT
jgi:signal transduction histidine kinase